MTPMNEAYNGAIGFFQQAVEVLDKANQYAGRKSLIDVSKHARVEPTMLVDAALMGYENLPAVSQTMLAIFSGYYLQAVEMMHTISGISLAEKLAPLNPNREPNVALMSANAAIRANSEWRLHRSSYLYGLPTHKNSVSLGMESVAKHAFNQGWHIALEADAGEVDHGFTISRNDNGVYTVKYKRFDGGDEVRTFGNREAIQNDLNFTNEQMEQLDRGLKKAGAEVTEKQLTKRVEQQRQIIQKLRDKLVEQTEQTATVTKDLTKMVTDVTPLSVGKLYEIQFKEQGETLTAKVAIRLIARMVPSSTITHISTLNSRGKTSMVERFHGVRSGELEFINDFILCNDLIDAHRKAMITDKSGVYKEIINRRNKSLLAGLLERNPSVAVASNLAIIDSTTLEQIEATMGGSFKNSKIRDTVFETTSLMILAVVDRGYDRVRFYHRGIDGFTDLSIREIKTTRGDGDQVSDIMKSFLKGSAPQI